MLPVFRTMNRREETLLLLNTDADVLRDLSRALSKTGYNVWPTASVKEARAAANAIRPDYAIIDLNVGESSGLDLVAHIRHWSPATTATFLGSQDNNASAVTAASLENTGCLPKAVDAAELHICLQSIRAFQVSEREHDNGKTANIEREQAMYRHSLPRGLIRASGEHKISAYAKAVILWLKRRWQPKLRARSALNFK
ncbi:MAG: response regulator [Rhizobiales bacterium]|nr:response regulator [Hyphomicrobiales bacterium]